MALIRSSNGGSKTFLVDTAPILVSYFCLFLFFPVIRIGGVPLPTVLFLLPLCLSFWVPTVYFRYCVIGSIYLFIMVSLNIYRNQAVGFGDLIYFLTPIVYLLTIILAYRLIETDIKTSFLFLQLFIYFELILLVLQIINPMDFNSYAISYLDLIAGNINSDGSYLNSYIMTNRPGGTVIISTWLGFAAYSVGRTLTIYSGKKHYLAISCLIVILSGARMPLITIIATESILLILSIYGKSINISKRELTSVIVFSVGFLLIAAKHPYLGYYMNALFDGRLLQALVTNAGVENRIRLARWAMTMPANFFIGGLTLSEIPFKAVESELLLRTLQFGFLGYLAFKLPLFALLIRSIHKKDEEMLYTAVLLLSISFFSSLTMITSSNMYFIIVFSTIIAFSEANSHHRIPKVEDE